MIAACAGVAVRPLGGRVVRFCEKHMFEHILCKIRWQEGRRQGVVESAPGSSDLDNR